MGDNNVIKDIIIFGDSLSGRGRMANRKLFDFFSMNRICGLEGKSFYGRFANFYVWSDYLSKKFASMSGYDNPDLDDPYRVRSSTGETLVRTFCEGGATSADYSFKFDTFDIEKLAAREILTNLDALREELIENDDSIGITTDEKKNTLVIEWTGANDLCTVNSKPTVEIARIAVEERLNHVKEMHKLGYQNFVLLTLPDISKTPRFKKLSIEEQSEAHNVLAYFNIKLIEGVRKLSNECDSLNCSVYNINSKFCRVIENPTLYRFDEEKINETFVESEQFVEGQKNAEASGYLFWDDVHPTSEMHKYLSKYLFDFLLLKFKFESPREPLIKVFRENYSYKIDKLNEECCSFLCFNSYKSSNKNKRKEFPNLKSIFEEGFLKNDKIVLEVLVDLGWVDSSDNTLINQNPDLVKASEGIIESKNLHLDIAKAV